MLGDSLRQMAAARQRWSRLGEHWPQGPVGQRTTTPAAIGDIVARLRQFETAVTDPADLHHQLRRLHYSRHVRWPYGRKRGTRLDALLAGPDDEPVTWSAAPVGPAPALLDWLVAAGRLTAGPAEVIDVGGLFTATDAAFAGGSDLGTVAEQVSGVPIEGLATWVGDLACWYLEWRARRQRAAEAGQPWSPQQAEVQFLDVQRAEMPLDLALSSIDGQVLAAYFGGVVRGSLDSVPRASETLERYYASRPPATSDLHLHVGRRFALFVHGAMPTIPYTGQGDQAKPGPDAPQRIQGYLTQAATFFLHHGLRDRSFGASVAAPSGQLPQSKETVAQELASDTGTLAAIAVRFVDLIRVGLQVGRAPEAWPRGG